MPSEVINYKGEFGKLRHNLAELRLHLRNGFDRLEQTILECERRITMRVGAIIVFEISLLMVILLLIC